MTAWRRGAGCDIDASGVSDVKSSVFQYFDVLLGSVLLPPFETIVPPKKNRYKLNFFVHFFIYVGSYVSA
jgi:hypothetical protein